MDNEKIGRLIYSLRTEKNMTQRELAERISVGDKAVSKWERGLGCPDVSLLPALAEVFGVGVEQLLLGDLPENEERSGNMKKLKFFVCPVCGSIITATAACSVSCCGRKLEPLEAKAPDEEHDLSVEAVEDEWFVSAAHAMEKEHHISFVAYVTGDRAETVKTYAEWELQVRFFRRGHGRLFWFCTRDGLFAKTI
jgi:transcriptional regulator with XRE-family HTH domain/desulfoferrodoxin (superoxide reductase-like protein)